ncbi:FtsX-like permease family protein [Micromonosporaceae bacterium Da 78-11]
MALTLRRATAARGLLTAAAVVALGATLLLAGLTGYGRAATEAGVRSAVASAAPDERSILVRGDAGADPAAADRALRAAFAGGLAGRATTVHTAGYASGWAFAGRLGDATPDEDGIAYASVVTLEDLPAHAELVGGAWPAGNSAALAEPVAGLLGVRAGDTLRLVDRRTGRDTRVPVAGVWRPRDAHDPYWRLVPEAFLGLTPQTTTYGPIVVARDDFDRRFAQGASAGWLAEPDLAGATLDQVSAAAGAAARTDAALPQATGLGRSATVTTGIGGLRDRLQRADLVGRSALVTPMLLILVLGGYALLLVALLLTDSRRGETALLRARGAARGQLVVLAAREALLVVLPAALLAPPLAILLIRVLGRVPLLAGSLHLTPRLDATVWLTGVLAATGGALALIGPAIRRGGTYVAATAGRSRRSIVQRAGLDLVLLALAVLGWLQLRQYASPLGAGSLGAGPAGIDPLLAAAPTLGVLAGAVLALRALPPLARFAARRLDRWASSATMLGTWQAARRSHAGPMVLLALAVAAGTVSWALAGTAQQSLTDQADQQVGADLRLVEVAGTAPADRGTTLAALPGVGAVLPAWRDSIRLESGAGSADLLALDTARADGVVRIRDDVAGGNPATLFRRLAEARETSSAGTLTAGTITTRGDPVRTTAVLADGRRIDLGVSTGRVPRRFTAAGAGLAGFIVEPVASAGLTPAWTTWRITGLDPGWRAVGRSGESETIDADGNLLFTGRVAVVPPIPATPVPIAATPQALTGLHLREGGLTALSIGGVPIDVRVVATVAAVPGTTSPAAVLADLPALTTHLLNGYGVVTSPQEWLISGTAATREAALAVPGARVLDRHTIAAEAGRDPFGVGSRAALFAAAFGAVLLAAAGIAVDVQATARRRAVELAVLHTLGAGPRLLARALVVEQAFLAGLGALAGLGVGLLVAAAMAPLLILTPTAGRPVPEPLLHFDWGRIVGTAALLVLLALALSAIAAAVAGRRLPATRLRIGADR